MNSIISADSFDKYGLNDRCRKSRERVQRFLDRGFMSQDAVYHRYTEELSEKRTSAVRSEQPAVINDIRAFFQRLLDPATGNFSETLFVHEAAQCLTSLSNPSPEETSRILLDILAYHAYHPFPPPHHSSGHLELNEDAFVRAICLLTLSPAYRSNGKFLPSSGRSSSGTWGPYSGDYVELRRTDASDFGRRLFRSIAITDGTTPNRETTMSVPRFKWYKWHAYFSLGDGDEDDDYTEIVVAEKEREVDVDVLDVLSECPPGKIPTTANPFRESYRIVLQSLPQCTDDLATLFVTPARLAGLMKMLQQVQSENNADLKAKVERFGNDDRVDSKEFQSVFAEHAELIVDGLSMIYGAFAVPDTSGRKGQAA